MQVKADIIVYAPISDVFRITSDLSRAEERIRGIKEIEMLAGPAQMQVGTKWKETREMFGKEATEIMWITALEPDKRYVAEAESHGTKYWSEFAFEEVDGGTRVQMTFRGTPQTLFAKIMSALMGSMMKGSLVKVMKEDLEDIKVAAEK